MLISEIYQPTTRTINENTTLAEALQILMDNDINGFVVIDDAEHIVGIFSTQDLAAATVPPEFQNNKNLAKAMYRPGYFHERCKALMTHPIKDFMRKNIVTVSPNDHVMIVASDFLQNDLYVVPVIENDRLVGIVTRSNIKKAIAKAMGLEK